MKYKENKKCLICDNGNLFEYLDLNEQPLANSYHKGEILDLYPLRINVCTKCWHSQLSVSVEPDEMFKHYLYIPDTSKTLTDYFIWTKNHILQKTKESPKKVLEIACNSGLFLEMFNDKNTECVGVDPAENLRELSLQRNLDVYIDYWNTEFSEKLKTERGKFDLILAFHVLPHVESPNEFIASCKNVLSDTGTIFVQTSQCDMFLNNEFDVIYHEHSSYFTANSIKTLARNHKLFVSHIMKTDIHGKSFLFSLQKEKCDEIELNDLIQKEQNDDIYSKGKYLNFASKANDTKQKLINGIAKFKENGYTIIGYGAAAKGNTLLNYIECDLDYIIDDNDMKWDYLTPGRNIEIHGIQLLERNFDKICFIPLAWNFYLEITDRINKKRDTKNDVFIKYFPTYIEL